MSNSVALLAQVLSCQSRSYSVSPPSTVPAQRSSEMSMENALEGKMGGLGISDATIKFFETKKISDEESFALLAADEKSSSRRSSP